MNKTTFRAAAVAAALIFGAAAPAHADVMTWNLSGVTFTDGTTASGFVNMDPTAKVKSTFNVSTMNGGLSAFTYDNSNSGLYFGGGAGPNNFILFTNQGNRYFNFSFTNALNASGGSFALNTASSYECTNCGQFRMVTGGSLSTAATDVPEPGTVALLIPALGMLGWMSRRRKNQLAK